MDYALGEWLPDLGEQGQGLDVVSNLAPHVDGYRGLRSPEVVELGTLDSECLGAESGRLQNGTTWLAGGTDKKLWVIESGSAFVDRSKAGDYGGSDASQWDFDQYASTIYASNRTDPIQKYQPGVDSLFSDLSADASLGSSIMVADDFLVAGNIQGQGVNAGAIDLREAGVHWSARGDPSSWPQVGTDPAVAAQSDFQVLEGDGGPVTALVRAEEWSFIARERQIWRMDYVGGTDIFSFRLLDAHRGCVAPNAAQAVGNYVYYPSEDGFMRCNGADVEPIGLEKVDIFWKTQQDFSALSWVSVAHDAENQMVWWTLCKGSRPTSLIGFAYNLGRWSTMDIAPRRIFAVKGGLGQTMDSTPYFGTSDMDATTGVPAALGDVDMDTLRGFSEQALGHFDSSHRLQTHTDSRVMIGFVRTKDLAFRKRHLLRHVTPYYTNVLPGVLTGSQSPISMTVETRISAQDRPVWSGIKAINRTGKIPFRAAGRFFRFGFITGDPLWRVQGFDLEMVERGSR